MKKAPLTRLALAAALGGAFLLTVGSASASSSRVRDEVALRLLVGQHLMVRLTGTTPSAELLARVRRGEVGGVIFFSDSVRSVAGVKATIAKLQAAAAQAGRPRLLVAVDQEGGRVRRLRDGPPFRSPAELGAAGGAEARRAGLATGKYLRAVGVNVDLAPVLDVPDSPSSFLGDRAFGLHPASVERAGVAFASGLQAKGVAATAKHFPGLGTAGANTDAADLRISTGRRELLGRLAPFEAAVRSGIRLVMVSNARYPALDASGLPAVLSPRIVTGLLRDTLGFDGVVVSDTLAAPAPASYGDAAVRALRAGVDVLLYTRSDWASADAYRALLEAAQAGRLSRQALESSSERIAELKVWLERPRFPAAVSPPR